MTKFATTVSTIVITLIALNAITNTAHAAPTIPSGNTGGGVGSSTQSNAFTMPYQASSSAEINGIGYGLRASVTDYEARIDGHWHYAKDGTKEWWHIIEEDKRTIVNFSGGINDGEIGTDQNAVFLDIDLEANQRIDGYEFDWTARFLLTGDKEVDSNFPGYINLTGGGGILGAEYHIGADVDYRSWWSYNEETGEWEEHKTRDIYFDIFGDFKESEGAGLNIKVDTFALNSNGVNYDGIKFSGHFFAMLPEETDEPVDDDPIIIIGDIEKPSPVYVTEAVPEPATMSLLTLGTLTILGRRRRKS
jgi:hypothetical protein